MPRKKHVLGLQKSKESINVTLHQSNLKTDSTGHKVLYGKVRQRPCTIKTILADMEKNQTGCLNKDTMYYAACEIANQMMYKLKQGYSLEMFGFGTLFITMKGSIPSNATPSEVAKHFQIGFTPSEEAKKAVQNFEVANILHVQEQHYINTVCTARASETEKNVICKDDIARITGCALKMSDPDHSLYAAPLNNAKEIVPDTSKWILLSKIITNLPKQIEFIVPNGLKDDEYKIVIETNLSASGKTMKENIRIVSDIVSIK